MTYDLIVIGAGASGLVAAIAAARSGCRVLVIEKKETAGKKILATGNGKCNFTNMLQTDKCYRSEDIDFVLKVLSSFDVHKTIDFFRELGIYPKEKNGYLYPNSEQASSVVKVLMMECARLNVKFSFNETVRAIKEPLFTVICEALEIKSPAANTSATDKRDKKKDNKALSKGNELKRMSRSGQEIIIKKKSYYAKKVILAAGGCAYPKLGSDGSGFLLAKALGHNIIKPLPALVQLRSAEKFCKNLAGVRTEAAVELFADNKLCAKEYGEVLFTDYGISGIPVLQISRFAAKALDCDSRVYLKLDFLPAMTRQELSRLLGERCSFNPDRTIEEMMTGLLNNKLAFAIIKQASLEPNKLSGRMSRQELDLLSGCIKEFIMQINGTNSFEEAQVCAGGIDTAEVDSATMQSRLVKGLYFAGEILDVDGTCGGYNLQWAWSSGYLAGASAARALAGKDINQE